MPKTLSPARPVTMAVAVYLVGAAVLASTVNRGSPG
jgi:hypothetical protein